MDFWSFRIREVKMTRFSEFGNQIVVSSKRGFQITVVYQIGGVLLYLLVFGIGRTVHDLCWPVMV